MPDTKLFVYKTGFFLAYNEDINSYISECSRYIEVRDKEDPKISRHIQLCKEYGFNPEVIIRF